MNEKTGKFNRRKRFGRSIQKRSPGYFVKQAKYRFSATGGLVQEVNNWSFKASQFDHMLRTTQKKQLSKRWHVLPNGLKIQRDLYSAFLLYCANQSLDQPDVDRCDSIFNTFFSFHERCIQDIQKNRRLVCNSGIKWNTEEKRKTVGS